MKIIGRIFRNDKSTVYLIVIFVVALISLFAIKARASEFELEVGSAVVRGETPVIGMNLAFTRAGPIGTDYELGFDLIGESEHYRQNPNSIQLRAQMVDSYKRFGAGIGFFYQNAPGEYTCDFGFHLLARYIVSSRFSIQWRHSSSAGSCEPNSGRDLLTLGYRF